MFLAKRKIYDDKNYVTLILSFGLLLTFIISIKIHVFIDSKYNFNVHMVSASNEHNYNQLEPRIIFEKSTRFRVRAPMTVKNSTLDYGGLLIDPVVNWSLGRIIQDFSHLTGHIWDSKDGDDYVSSHYAFDDDYNRHHSCRRVSWHRLNNPNCNIIHENPLFNSSVVSHGAYNHVFKLTDRVIGNNIVKTLRYKKKRRFDYKYYEKKRIDALVMERLTSSPRIANIFGYCGTTITQEVFAKDIEPLIVPGEGMILGDKKLNDADDVNPQNDFTPTQKLQFALDMAEAIADLHGFPDGVIVHDDIQICQFLVTPDGRLKLNDFNRAEIMLWDEKNQKYCKYNNGLVYGNFRSLEEIRDDPLDEKIDVWSFGNIVYGLLTGLWVFYDTEDDTVVQKRIKKGETAYIDSRYRTRSYAEGVMVEIIEKCWVRNSSQRIDIFELVKYLKKAVIKNSQISKTK